MDTKFAPYAPASAVLAIIRHYRSKDVPERVTTTNLLQIGVSESLIPRTLAALKFLNLIRDDETTTEQFRALRYASDDDYQEVIGRMLDAAYKDVLDHIDMATATDREINNAFIPYSPGGQRERMISLFLALAKEAGWATAIQPKVTAPRPKATVTPKAVRATARAAVKARGALSEPRIEDRKSAPPASDETLFGLTAADLSVLDDQEVDTVWSALGLVVKARARNLRHLREVAEQAAARTAKEGGET